MSWCPKRWAVTLLIPVACCGPALAQNHPSNYRITDLVHEITGNVIRLTVEPNVKLSPPAVQYLNSANGEYIMACDFPGVVWNRPTQVIFPSLNGLEQIRIGQFQANPPICRIAISAQKLALLHKLSFQTQPGVLSLKWPADRRAAGYATAKKTTPAALAPAASTERPAKALAAPVRSGNSSYPLQSPLVMGPPVSPSRIRRAPASNWDARLNTGSGLAQTAPPANLQAQTPIMANAQRQIPAVAPVPPAAPPLTSSSAPLPGAGTVYSSSLPPDGIQLPDSSLPPVAPNRPRGLSPRSRLNSAPPFVPTTIPGRSQNSAPANRATPVSDSTGRQLPLTSTGQPASASAIRQVSQLPPVAPLIVPANKSTSQPGNKPAISTASSDKGRSAGVIAPTSPQIPSPPVVAPAADKAAVFNPSAAAVRAGVSPDQLIVQDIQALEYRTFRLHEPERFVLDFKHFPALQNAANSADLSNSLLKSWRTGHPQDDASIARLVLDLDSAETVVKEELNPDQQILTLTLQKAGSSAEKIHLPAGTTLVIDAGHGGSDPGAQRGDIQEKEITLGIVEKLRKKLTQAGAKVTMTRSDDTFVSLEERVNITNTTVPKVFLSVHINSLETNSNISGIETYYQTEQSKALADAVHKSLVGKLAAPDRNVRKARFYVINHTPVPSILAEVGFISNKEERSKLVSAEYQEQIADALIDGIAIYVTGADVQGNTAHAGTRPANTQLAQKSTSLPADKKESK